MAFALCALAIVALPRVAQAERITVYVRGEAPVSGELIEGVTGDYLLLRRDDSTTWFVPWSDIAAVRDADGKAWSRAHAAGDAGVDGR